ncbi:heme exporter protein CcmD [Achromobacter sp. 2789STDY5608621]|uniref:heme exporter protein CcmD n=1 Tax=Achromobacter sp. 2789STDY5608621 TaxID=1806496 RepID=UPI0006C5813E|nr:heme exporter protein CcmD [Achromobacter sp. 2789STDY5608621]CUJ30804.1 heme exporter protein CcmD [Achromobacter sp. 2789STDY5608621]
MQWESWAAFWHMGGSGAFVWGSYGALALLVLAECVALARRRRRAIRRIAARHRARRAPGEPL